MNSIYLYYKPVYCHKLSDKLRSNLLERRYCPILTILSLFLFAINLHHIKCSPISSSVLYFDFTFDFTSNFTLTNHFSPCTVYIVHLLTYQQ